MAARLLIFKNKRYTEEEFIIPSQDTKGHSERIYFRVQPGHARELNMMLASKKFPFRTMGDMLRLFTKLGIDLLKTVETFPSVSGQVDSVLKIVRDEQFYLEFISIYEQAGNAINRYIGSGEHGQARKLVVMMREEIRKMPKGYWREKYGKELKNKFGYLLKDAGAGLTEAETETEAEDDTETPHS